MVDQFTEHDLYLRSELYKQEQDRLRQNIVEQNPGLAFGPDVHIAGSRDQLLPPAISPHPLSVANSSEEEMEPMDIDMNYSAIPRQELIQKMQSVKRELRDLKKQVKKLDKRSRTQIREPPDAPKSESGWETLRKYALRGVVISSLFLGLTRIQYYFHEVMLTKGDGVWDSAFQQSFILKRALTSWRLLFKSERKFVIDALSVVVRSTLNIVSVRYLCLDSSSSQTLGCLLSLLVHLSERTFWKPKKLKIFPRVVTFNGAAAWMYFLSQYLDSSGVLQFLIKVK